MTGSGHTVPGNNGRTRDARAYKAAARHSKGVRWAKLGLPVAGLAMAAVFAGYTVFARPDLPGDISVDLTKTAVTDGKVVMADPRMSGFTKDNRPYEMEAERAIQDVANAAEITLENIKASVPFRDDVAARIIAESALYNNETRTLVMDKPFTVTSSDGMQASFSSAFMDIGDGNMKTDDPVDIKLNGAHITAQSMHVTERGKVLVFENNVRLNIDPASAKSMTSAGAARQDEGNRP